MEMIDLKKKIYIIAMILISLIPTYFIFLWQPADNQIELANELNVTKEAIQKTYTQSVNTDTTEIQKTNKKPILRVQRDKIKELLSDDDKKKINEILNKLSTVDLNRAEELINNKDSDSIKEFILLIKKRLSLKDYKQIETILVPFINFESIN